MEKEKEVVSTLDQVVQEAVEQYCEERREQQKRQAQEDAILAQICIAEKGAGADVEEGLGEGFTESPSGELPKPALPARRKAHGQTGPKSLAGKNKARWNALKDGSTAKSSVLPFEDERLYQRHIAEVEKALQPTNYVEVQMVREYAEGLWRIVRHEKRGAYERQFILERITPAQVASMLGLDERYIKSAPDYLTDLKYKILKKEQAIAKEAFAQYQHLLANAKGIPNFNMVWHQYRLLFEELAIWVRQNYPDYLPILSGNRQALNLPYQQNPKKILEFIEAFSNCLFFMMHFEEFKPAIRVWMESWFFLQRSEMRQLEADDQLLMKERNYTYAMLDKLLRFRKTNGYLLTMPANLSVMEGNHNTT